MILRPVRLVSAAFTRPANTTAYATGDAMGAGAAGCILTFDGVFDSGRVASARLAKSAQGNTTNDDFGLLLFRRRPSVNPDDNAAPTTSWLKWVDRAAYAGKIDFKTAAVHADAIFYEGQDMVPAGGVPFQRDRDEPPLFGILTALAAYAPASAENFHIQLEIRTE